MERDLRDRNASAPLHVIVGAGQVGPKVAEALIERGMRVRIVRRGAADPGVAGAEFVRADALDAASMDAALRGASVVYDCANPARYHAWAAELPPLRRGVRDAAMRAGARLVVLENLYMLGRGQGHPRRPEDPHAPCSGKGELRARLEDELLELGARGELRFAVGRASDFFGPGADQGSFLSLDALRAIAKGGTVLVPRSADMPHAYSYVPDVAAGLARLGLDDAASGIFHLPVAAQVSTRELVARHAAVVGTTPKVREIPSWFFRASGLVVPTFGAMTEMLYQWEAPFEVDDSAFCARYDVRPTALDDAARANMAQVVGALSTGPADRSPSARSTAAS